MMTVWAPLSNYSINNDDWIRGCYDDFEFDIIRIRTKYLLQHIMLHYCVKTGTMTFLHFNRLKGIQ